jgi:hypothetical protein
MCGFRGGSIGGVCWMEFDVEPVSERFDPLDDRWLAQVAHLATELGREVGGVRRRSAPAAGKKGDLGAIVLALGSAGAFTAAVEVLKAFVARDQGRSVRLSWHEDGRLASLEVSGRGVDDATVTRVLGALDGTAGPAR